MPLAKYCSKHSDSKKQEKTSKQDTKSSNSETNNDQAKTGRGKLTPNPNLDPVKRLKNKNTKQQAQLGISEELVNRMPLAKQCPKHADSKKKVKASKQDIKPSNSETNNDQANSGRGKLPANLDPVKRLKNTNTKQQAQLGISEELVNMMPLAKQCPKHADSKKKVKTSKQDIKPSNSETNNDQANSGRGKLPANLDPVKRLKNTNTKQQAQLGISEELVNRMPLAKQHTKHADSKKKVKTSKQDIEPSSSEPINDQAKTRQGKLPANLDSIKADIINDVVTKCYPENRTEREIKEMGRNTTRLQKMMEQLNEEQIKLLSNLTISCRTPNVSPKHSNHNANTSTLNNDGLQSAKPEASAQSTRCDDPTTEKINEKKGKDGHVQEHKKQFHK